MKGAEPSLSPSVSVYIPTYNRPAMLKRAVLSVLAQTHNNIEILVVDDGSSIENQGEIKKLAEQLGFSVITNENSKGACGARNTAIKYARGDYITGLDDDDEFQPERIAELIERFQPAQYSCIATTSSVITCTGKIIRNADSGEISLDSLLHYNKIGNQVFTLTERLRGINGFDEAMPAFQDYDTWVRLVHKYGPALKIKSPSYITHTEHEQRISSSSTKRVQAAERFLGKHKHLMSKQHLKSFQLIMMKLSGEKPSATSLLRVVSRENWKSALTFYMDSYFQRPANVLRAILSRVSGRL
ncbi:cell wall biosynthesis glycosyltransferase-like protein [Alcanivorax hongdengensis A-11-3]|uniref:Cell wall biosynthesis glycosyltransferase-like protein n=1 Tax=Alcanivorax hongdengensis A-11-3 TaxID=1177179 RepID=L0W8H6_9GAMM|nr:glycosyltransferase [Alcanivorax hongdengensis]EKF73274.1 cell wall biosynthesis glycosyltransferase-like protein [Alcanivorax hongdengensis A-11-3]